MRTARPSPNRAHPPSTSTSQSPGEPPQSTENLPNSPTKSPLRPPLQRKPASTSPQQHGDDIRPPQHRQHPPKNVAPVEDETSSQEMSSGEGQTVPAALSANAKGGMDSLEASRLQRLKDQINEKMSHSQQRARAIPPRAASVSLGGRRVSPIKEEGTAPSISPTLEGAFSSPLPTEQPTASSTVSTESGRTIRGSVPATPNQAPLHTPSYPFPHVGSPKVWSSAFHRPFTALSPTVSSANIQDKGTPHEGSISELSTPHATASDFMPPGASPTSQADEDRFPTPNLYDLTLELSLEPGLSAWWDTVSRVMSRDFGAARISLAMPADAGELENVPWGQKATFSMSGPPEIEHSSRRTEAPLRIPDFGNTQAPYIPAPLRNVHEEDSGPRAASRGGRPMMSSRHSYAGYERKRDDLATASPSARAERPNAPLRTKSYASQGMFRASPEQHIPPLSPGGPSQFSGREINFSDLDFSSIESVAPSGPFCTVLPVLRALNYESHALINSTYVNRIIERSKMVILTRDYSGDDSLRKSSLETSHNLTSSVGQPTGDPLKKTNVASEFQRKNTTWRERKKEKGKLSHDYGSRDKPFSAYDEYEQFPSSPWSQSPAPSPAIQADQDENPFFASGDVDEESFNPKGHTPDYSKLTQVEAIGVDKASTVIHIPFMHPLLSQNLPANMNEAEPDTPSGIHFGRLARYYDGAKSGDQTPMKKAPIAILSILSPVVPYPHNLIHSLKLLALHLTTSFANAHQYSSTHRIASGIHQRRMGTTHKMGFAPLSTDTEGLELLAEADIDLSTGSVTGSITSPSDYSERSRASPGGSLLGTPGWDTGVIFSSRQSTGGTPGHGAEMLDSYFEAKKKMTTRPATAAAGQKGRESLPLQTPIRDQISEEDIDTPKSNPQRPRVTSQESSTVSSGGRNEQPAAIANVNSPSRPSIKASSVSPHVDRGDPRRHSLLHSYGADFNSTFQGLSSTTTINRRVSETVRQGGDEEVQDMLPPSERLLRTIIDALPVQIFTAAPVSGSLTWVNSKFVAYRGREPHQIIQDPWQAIHPGDREHYMEQWQRSLKTGQPFSHKVRLQRFDDQYRWFFVRATPLKDKRQNIVHWTGTYMDIHEQHVAELNAARQQETAASEARYRALANSSPQIVFAVTQTRGIIFCNSQWLLYAGQTEAEARTLGFMDFVHPDDLAKCRLPTLNEDGTYVVDAPTTVPMETKKNHSPESSDDSSETDKTVTSPGGTSPDTMPLPQKKLSELAGTGILKVSRDSDGRPSYTTEVRLRNKDGEYRWHLVRVLLSAPVRDDDEEEETWYGTCTDINDHKLLEQTLKETMDAKSRFLSNMSHEIRTPLNGITGMVNFLIDSHLTQEQLEHVHIIRNSTEGLRDLINDILDLSKVEAGMISLLHDWLHLRSLIEEVNDLTSAMAVGKGLELNYLIEDNVPPMVKGDRFRLRQVLLNIVGNAIKFTQHGEVFVHCEVGDEKPAGIESDEMMLRFHVTDTGSGFNEKEAEFLFKRFSQIDSSSTKQHGGTGLGLAISMQLVELHGGWMTATSVPNKGSTFTFMVKFQISSAKDQPPELPVQFPSTQDETLDRRLSSHIPRAAASYTPGLPPMPPTSPGTKSPSISSPIRYTHDSAASSGSSDPSIRTARTSIGSHRSSASSLSESVFNKSQPISLELPAHIRGGRPVTLEEASIPSSTESLQTVRHSSVEPTAPRSLSPLPVAMYSILVVCPLALSRRATVKHIDTTIPKNLPNHITAPDSVDECKRMLGMLGSDDPVIFTHIVVMLQDIHEIIALIDQALRSPAYSSTSILIITDFQQRKEIEEQAKNFDYKQLAKDSMRIRWVYKPLKPSKFAVIFDPEKLRELSTDRSQDSAQAVVVSQKQVFDEMRRRLGNRGIRVLLVEDNKTNQMVLLKFLKRSEIEAESVLDGVQCTDKVFSQPPDYYSIILCDLHMPNKDGYQTCKDIRRWERKNKYKHLPIIALSANVLGDVYAKCVEAGFNSYVTKPVDFKELSVQLNKFLDPEVKGREHEFMSRRGDE